MKHLDIIISSFSISNLYLPLSVLRFFPNDCLVFLLLLKYFASISSSARNSSLGPPSGMSCLRAALLFLRVLVRCPVSLDPYPGFISKSPYILFINALFSSIKRSIRSLQQLILLIHIIIYIRQLNIILTIFLFSVS